MTLVTGQTRGLGSFPRNAADPAVRASVTRREGVAHAPVTRRERRRPCSGMLACYGMANVVQPSRRSLLRALRTMASVPRFNPFKVMGENKPSPA